MRALPGLLALLFGTFAASAAPAQETRAGSELITGIVHPMGAGAQSPGGLWTLHFSLEAWRGADGIIRSTRLVIQRTSHDEEVSALMDRINATRIISAHVRYTGEGFAELLKLVDVDLPADDPLVVRAAELARPVTRQDARFGTLTLNRALEMWEGKAVWAGDTIDIHLEAVNEDTLVPVLATAGALWDDQAGWSERIQAYAVEELLEMKNDGWLDEGEAPLTPAQFLARMRLTAISNSPDGSFTFWHDDGELFSGHTIQIMGSLREGPTYADIAG